MTWKNTVALLAALAVLGSISASANFLYDRFIHDRFFSPSSAAALPQGPAVFETSLQDRISSTDTSLTLVANSVRGGSSLSGYNCFTLDEGRTDMEYVCGTVSGTAVTALERGIDPGTGTTTNSAVKFAHRKGANVKVTDFPLIQRLRAILNGSDTIPNLLTYAGNFCTAGSASTSVCSKAYMDALAAQGAPTSTEAVAGIIRIATALQQASSTDLGVNDPLALSSKYATSSPNGTLAANFALVLDHFGKITQAAIDFARATTWTALHIFSAGLTVSAGPTTLNCSSTTPGGNTCVFNNNVPNQFPTAQCASGQAWVNNGSGVWSCATVPTGNLPRYIGNAIGFTSADSLQTGGTSTPGTLSANLLGTNGIVEVLVNLTAYSDSSNNSNATVMLRFGNSDVCGITLPSGAGGYGAGGVRFTVAASSSAAAQFTQAHAANGLGSVATCGSIIDTTQAQTINVIAYWNANDGGDTETLTVNRTSASFLGSN